MTLDVWQQSVLEQLSGLVDLAQRRLTAGPARPAARVVDGYLEWTLPWSVDDQNGLVRLTVFEPPDSTHQRPLIRVVVLAEATPFDAAGEHAVLDLPRYDYAKRYDPLTLAKVLPPGLFNRAKLTKTMAEYLCKQTGGRRLRPEADWAMSFTIALHT